MSNDVSKKENSLLTTRLGSNFAKNAAVSDAQMTMKSTNMTENPKGCWVLAGESINIIDDLGFKYFHLQKQSQEYDSNTSGTLVQYARKMETYM